MTLEAVLSALAACKVEPKGSLAHDATTIDPASWTSALERAPSHDASTPSAYKLTKTLVFKPGKPKTDEWTPVMVIAREETNTRALKTFCGQLGLSDLRLADDKHIEGKYGAQKNSVSALSLNEDRINISVVVLDSTIASSDEIFAVKAASSEGTVFLAGRDIHAYLQSLDKSSQKLHVVDFAKLAEEEAASAAASSSHPAPIAKAAAPTKKTDARIEDAHQLAIGVKKEVDFSTWYTNVLVKSEMLDYYNVSGCYILKPWSYSIWETIQRWFDNEIKELGVENSYFPMFVSSKVLEREKDHIEGFAPEVAWVTRAGSSELEEPIAIRPTSETVMYPYYAKWIQSHRDFPLKLNQWNSVVRWEFKTPQPFLRTREFLWQEGHTAFLTKDEADVEVRQILDLYRRVYEELLAVPVVPGIKSEKEKFAGGLYTTTVEGFIPTTGRGIQGATSHCLGQNFSKMFDISVEDPNATAKGERLYAWQNSWGLSTRTIGVMVMVHGDNQGLVLPPRVANIQVVIVPCGVNEKTRQKVYDACDEVAKQLKKVGIRAKADLRDTYLPGWKFNYWEQKGVPVRLEIGPKDIEKKQAIVARRDNSEKSTISVENLKSDIPSLLERIQADMFTRAKEVFDQRLIEVTKWEDVVPTLDNKCVAVIPWCEVEACEDDIKERSGRSAEQTDERAPSAGAKSLAIPFDQSRWPAIEPGKTKCPACGGDAKRWTMFGRSY
ncbi:probable proline-tRNA ligase [Serendipita indica DSM 11827]|uniref:proline--tRNA ligase n=1 Tax=Serendipita indica (strain DSM 11827) TaxID=1109443 RepID=G4T7Q7_SERID|nr:probable proline-tRNA ligase [Serendipita indica DSM 11827]